VQAVLLDLRDKYLEVENLLNSPSPTAVTRQVIIDGGRAPDEIKPNTVPHSSPVKKEDMEKREESTGLASAGKETHPETAPEELVQTHVPEEVSHNSRPQRNHTSNRDINLITVSGLMNWADESVKKLGHQKTKTMLDVAEMIGLLSSDLNRIMTKFISIDKDGNSESLLARDYLGSLLKITALQGKDNQTEEALLAIFPWKGDRG
jgi:archaellum component FlaD/FlaE